MRACVRIGALLTNASEPALAALTAYGNYVGLAFQVVDDILDEESTTEQLGKDAGSDRENGKATFPFVCGMQQSKQYAEELVANACRELGIFGSKAATLSALAQFIRTRVS